MLWNFVKQIKIQVKRILIKILFSIGLPALIRLLFQKKKTTIIYYHNISKQKFSEHVKFLSRKYSIVSLDDYLNNRIPKSVKNRLIITLDDGYKENKDLQEVLGLYNLSATVYLTAGIVNTNNGLWFLSKFMKGEKERLKILPNKERIEYLEKNKRFNQNEETDLRISLSLEEINSMKNFSFGSHTMYHPCLKMCTYEEALVEIQNSKIHLEKLLSRPIISLAFPDGSFGDREIEISKLSGYKAVLTSKKGFNNYDFKSYTLKRFSIPDSCSIPELYLRVTGVWFFVRKFVR